MGIISFICLLAYTLQGLLFFCDHFSQTVQTLYTLKLFALLCIYQSLKFELHMNMYVWLHGHVRLLLL